MILLAFPDIHCVSDPPGIRQHNGHPTMCLHSVLTLLQNFKVVQNKGEIISEGVVTPAFIDAHAHIGMARAGEPSVEDEANEHMDPIYPLVNALHSVYMDDSAFQESVESNVLYTVVFVI